jgi:pyridoxamine 5'-phosphate oxidase
MDLFDKSRNEHNDFLKGQLNDGYTGQPLTLFQQWFQEAYDQECREPNAVVLSTVSADGQPSSRILFLREFDENGYVMYTNYNSRKGEDIQTNSKVTLLFFWAELERQIRIEGTIGKVDPLISDKYFASRPRKSQIGAWTSNQSERIESRQVLEEKFKLIEKKYPNEVPRPPHWGGLIVAPTYYEFWQGRAGRLHDRICFERKAEKWTSYRISP